MHDSTTDAPAVASATRPPLWRRIPLYIQIIIGLILGVALGLAISPATAQRFNIPANIILRLLNAVAPPLILVAVMQALIHAKVGGRMAGKLFFLLILNTLVAILVGLTVANVVRPGKHASLHVEGDTSAATTFKTDPVAELIENIPGSILGPLVNGRVIGVIFIAVAFGIAARQLPQDQRDSVARALDIFFRLILSTLHWIIALVPIAVLFKVAYVVGTQGFAPFKALAWFIAAVLLALLIQAIYYLTRVAIWSWVRPFDLIRHTRDALAMAFSTASSTVAMPVTYASLRQKVGLREESASLGALVGSNFNNDGTALYEAMCALFVAQMIGVDLTLTQQLLVILTSVAASVGAAGIPEAGLVTMTLVFSAVHLPTGYIALLLPIDWFLDRCRTAINVLGDMNVACMLEGKTRERASDIA
ncbi:MAG TPA: dicarboxylate/amino acid:cation symporter [Tepidisphaeraceae bacterium]